MMRTGPLKRCWRGGERVCWSKMPFFFVLLSFAHMLGLGRCWGRSSWVLGSTPRCQAGYVIVKGVWYLPDGHIVWGFRPSCDCRCRQA